MKDADILKLYLPCDGMVKDEKRHGFTIKSFAEDWVTLSYKEGLSADVQVQYFKPILREYDQLTDAEWNELQETESVLAVKDTVTCSVMSDIEPLLTPTQFLKLLEYKIDLFGWVKEGKAICKN